MFGLDLLAQTGPVPRGPTISLRLPRAADFHEWAQLRGESRAFLEPWEPRWSSNELEREAWRQRVRRSRAEFTAGTGVSFLIFENGSGRMVGGITAGNIRHGVSQSASIGYWMGERFAGNGTMGEALGLVVRHCFRTLRLHRLEAACIPDNIRSMRVLEKAGFQREGLLHSYLKINGAWQDHYLYALIADQRTGKPE